MVDSSKGDCGSPETLLRPVGRRLSLYPNEHCSLRVANRWQAACLPLDNFLVTIKVTLSK